MQIKAIHQSRRAQIWRLGGMIWLIFVTAFFASIDLYFAKLQLIQMVLVIIGILGISIGLFLFSIKSIRLVKKMQGESKGTYKLQDNGIKKWFLIILLLEIFCLNAATFTLLYLHQYLYIVPVDILIVALHFIPLAYIFAMPVYYWLGLTVLFVVILTMFFVPISAKTGNLSTLAALPSLIFIFLNWITVVYILRDGSRYLYKKSPQTRHSAQIPKV